jgi:hypothetical protein
MVNTPYLSWKKRRVSAVQLWEEKKNAYILRGAVEHMLGGSLESETGLGKGTGDEQHEENLDGRDLEDGGSRVVLVRKTDEERQDERHVGGQDVEHELLDVVEDAAALLDGVEDTGKVVVAENNVGRRLGHVAATKTHGDANVGALQTGAVVDSVARHGHELAAAVQGVDHAHLGGGRTAGHDEGELRETVQLVVGKRVKVGRRHDEALDDVGADELHAGGENADLDGDGPSSLGVIAGKHVDGNAGLVALEDTGAGLGAGRVIDADEAAEDEVALEGIAVEETTAHIIGRDDLVGALAGEGENAEAAAGHGFHVGEDFLLELRGERDGGVAVGGRDSDAAGKHALDGARGEGMDL